jgi:hypothetical protein
MAAEERYLELQPVVGEAEEGTMGEEWWGIGA